MAKKGMTPSQIGVMLRDSHGIAQVKAVTGSKILRILKSQGKSSCSHLRLFPTFSPHLSPRSTRFFSLPCFMGKLDEVGKWSKRHASAQSILAV